MPTYNRYPHALWLVEHAVGSFLAQNHPNTELILVNDCPEQVFQLQHPKIRVINRAERFQTLGEKLNFAISQCQGDYICRFDDDDISFPWRLRYSLNKLWQTRSEIWQSREIWMKTGAGLQFEDTGVYPAPSKAIWTRQLLEKVSGFTVMNSGQDIDLEHKIRRLGVEVVREPVGLEKTYYFYRWHSPSYHLSAKGDASYARIGQLPVSPGRISLHPAKIDDYVTEIRHHIQTLQTCPSANLS
jgi:glycosyltransferase involved in cell wall biosynthesis